MSPDTHKRIFELARKYKLSHLSSSLTSCDLIEEIYNRKSTNDLCVLSAGHGGVGLYVNLEKYEGLNAEELYLKYRTHPSRDIKSKIWVSSGSLGCAITIALGMALADRTRKVYVVISDGESYESTVDDTLKIKHKYKVDNLIIYLNMNGYSCIEAVDTTYLRTTMLSLDPNMIICDTSYIYQLYPFINGIEAHYHNLNDKDWEWIEKNA